MGFIIVKVLMKVIKMTYIRNVLYVSKLQTILLLLSKLLSNGLKMKFNTIECNVKGLNENVIIMGLSEGN